MKITDQKHLWRITACREPGEGWPALPISSRITMYPDQIIAEFDGEDLARWEAAGRWQVQGGPVRPRRREQLPTHKAARFARILHEMRILAASQSARARACQRCGDRPAVMPDGTSPPHRALHLRVREDGEEVTMAAIRKRCGAVITGGYRNGAHEGPCTCTRRSPHPGRHKCRCGRQW